MIKESIYLEFLDALINGEKSVCQQIVTHLLSEGVSIKEIYLSIFQKALYQIGKMWERGTIAIANEHLATHIIDSLINLHVPGTVEKKVGYTAVITCVDKEFHQLGAKMVANMFEVNGWDTYFLGANTPGRELISLISIKKPQVIGISFSFYLNYCRFLELLDSIVNSEFSGSILVGGQGISDEVLEKLKKDYPKVTYIKCINALDEFIVAFHSPGCKESA